MSVSAQVISFDKAAKKKGGKKMGNPQIEDGYTPIANELMDAMAMIQIPGNQMRCLIVIFRRTYGWSRKEVRLENSDFVAATGIKNTHISRALKALEDKKIIVTKNGNKVGLTYRINKRYHQWKSLPKMVTVTKNGNGVTKNGNIEGSLPLDENKIKNKTTLSASADAVDAKIPKSKPEEVESEKPTEAPPGAEPDFYLTAKKRKLTGKRLESFNRFWNDFSRKKDKAKAADAWLDIPTLTGKLVNEICTAAKAEAANRPNIRAAGRTPIYAQGWITGRRWEDEDLGSSGQATPATPAPVYETEESIMARRRDNG